jgi:3-hydroxyacyl-CoA dehydrogenase / enoyl-CoA hydratase / 3-hydroxybutyryl-CoA epimerase
VTDSLLLATPLGRLSVDASGVATLQMQMEGRVNKLNAASIQGLHDTVLALRDQLRPGAAAPGQPAVVGVILASAHSEFCVGADLDFVSQPPDAALMLTLVRQLHRAMRGLETLGVPVVALLEGSALGGGYELALAAHHRLALDSSTVQVGLPEVQLGLIPGGGGTQRLPRLIGLQPALELLLQGTLLRAPQALKRGLVDGLAPDAASLRAAAVAYILANPGARQPWDRPGVAAPAGGLSPADARNVVLGAAALLYKKTAGAFRAPEVLLAVVQEGLRLGIDAGLDVEARAFARRAVATDAMDMVRTLWTYKSAAERHDGLVAIDRAVWEADAGIRRVLVLGAGMMGGGLAWVCARAGYEVVLRDIHQAALDLARTHCDTEAGRALKHLDVAGRQLVLDRIVYTLDLEPARGCDLVIEAVVEDQALKHRVIREVEPLLAPQAIFASNTSALPITGLATASVAPERFIGLHFFSPVAQMPLLEIIEGEQTSSETTARVLNVCRRLRKVPIVVGDGYGFYTTRVFSAYIIEGANLVAEGFDPALVEWGARSVGMIVPPLQVFDEVSLRLGRHIVEQAEAYVGGVLGQPGVGLLLDLVDHHRRLGRADGAGFYSYLDGRRQGLWEGLASAVAARGGTVQTGDPVVQAAALGRRLLLVQVAAALRALDEGVLRRPQDADVGAVLGIGFAPNTGGPISWLERQRPALVQAELQALEAQFGARFAPGAWLARRVAGG